MSRDYTINGPTKRTADNGNNISAVHSAEYCQWLQYPPKFPRVPAVTAVSDPEILGVQAV